MEVVHKEGRNAGDIFLYTLSTCGWCRKTKAWLDERGLAYSYVDVDLVPSEEEDTVMDDVRRWNPQCNFPTVVVNNSTCITGFQPERMAEILKP